MSLSMEKMNVFAENLANSQTTGYKKKTYSVHSFKDMLVDMPDVTNTNRYAEKLPVATGSYIDGAAVKQQQGAMQQTGNNFNVAIMGEKIYFQTETKIPVGPNGQPDPTFGNPNQKSYSITRNGNFMADQAGWMVNSAGDYMLDVNNNRISLIDQLTPLPPGKTKRVATIPAERLRIDQFGNIFDTNDKAVGADGQPKPFATLKLVQWTNNANQPQPTKVDDPEPVDATQMQQLLKKYGFAMPDDHTVQGAGMQAIKAKEEFMKLIVQNQNDPRRGLYQPLAPGQLEPLNASLKQGYLESSNVDITSEMVNLMMTSKDYDMSQKLIGAEDKVLDKSINEMGRLQ